MFGKCICQCYATVSRIFIRYVYQPMEIFYILLITNKASNIVEDLDTIRLLSKVIPNVTGTTNNLTEEKVNEKSFDLIFSFDEVR